MIHIFFLSLSPNTNDNCCGRSNSSSINWFCIHGILVGRNVCAIAIKCRSRLRCEFQREEGNFTGTIDFYTCDFCGMEMTKPTEKPAMCIVVFHSASAGPVVFIVFRLRCLYASLLCKFVKCFWSCVCLWCYVSLAFSWFSVRTQPRDDDFFSFSPFHSLLLNANLCSTLLKCCLA